MSYQVLCTFDLKNASSVEYQAAYNDLEKLGLRRVVQGQKSKVVIPTTTVIGNYNGTTAAAVRDHVRDQVTAAFKARFLRAEIFVTVGGQDHTWGATTT